MQTHIPHTPTQKQIIAAIWYDKGFFHIKYPNKNMTAPKIQRAKNDAPNAPRKVLPGGIEISFIKCEIPTASHPVFVKDTSMNLPKLISNCFSTSSLINLNLAGLGCTCPLAVTPLVAPIPPAPVGLISSAMKG